MYVEEVCIDGFKSYAQRTIVPAFDPLFNAITGLNGSGKSNILDAIWWGGVTRSVKWTILRVISRCLPPYARLRVGSLPLPEGGSVWLQAAHNGIPPAVIISLNVVLNCLPKNKRA
jgi:hypothetical protein